MRKPWGRRNGDSPSAQSPINLATLPKGTVLELTSVAGNRFVVSTAGRFALGSGGGYRVVVGRAPIRCRGQVRMCVTSGSAKIEDVVAACNAEKSTVGPGDIVWLIDMIGTDHVGADAVRPFRVRAVSIAAAG